MRCRKSIFAAIFVFVACVVFADTKDTLTVATWNIRNYLPVNRRIDGKFRPDYPKPEAEKAALRAVIRQIDADVIALQEMGSGGHLAELQRDLESEGCVYPHAHVLAGADPVRQLAVLSRFPLREVREHSDMDFAYRDGRTSVSRGLLEVSVEAPGTGLGEGLSANRRVTLFVLHLKSRLTTFPDDPESATWRAKEAEAVRNRVLQRFPNPAATGGGGGRFLIAGDCNDVVSSRPIRALLKRGNTEIARLLPATDSRGETWTHYYAREETYSRVDNILVSPALAAAVVRMWVVDSPDVLVASDHRPVALELRWK
ncbi:endonuclease/exonuclease/phosphatase family protein [Opitutaceae bacterium TAV4]|nr:endonuclease/exonuclease/phosphatase family protein [Opitutaceae bacterium TAV4]RRJ99636.1 endonuclease/exonuclease/phosphatase family protein [Opitutaceae bacterium TAV3]